MRFFSFHGGFVVLRTIKWRHVYPILFSSICHHHQVEVFIQTLKILTSVNESKTFCHFCQDRQFTDNVWLHNVRGQFRLNFHCLKKLIDVWAADVKSTVAFKDSHLTDGYTDCSPWFRPLQSLQSSTTNAAFSRKVSNKNLSYSWSYPPLNRNYKMIFVSQQFLIFKKYNSQETIFILE